MVFFVAGLIPDLHSILVKSILVINHIPPFYFSIYIPFWLNLYHCPPDICFLLRFIYIPFWLNLYRTYTIIETGWTQIYIPFWLNLYIPASGDVGQYNIIYIPFWLNLYRCLLTNFLTFSNIIYIPFWLNLYGRSPCCRNVKKRIYIPFWLNLYTDGWAG